MNIKHKFKEITPPFIWRWLRNRIIKKRQAEKKYDPRRWWYGEDLLGDNSRFKEIFYFEKLQSSICMLNNEIRDCIEVEPSKSLKLDKAPLSLRLQLHAETKQIRIAEVIDSLYNTKPLSITKLETK